MSTELASDVAATPLIATCTKGDGPNIGRYPHLAWSPGKKTEPHVHTHMAQACVKEIHDSAVESGLVAAIEAHCEKHGTDVGETLNAIEYVMVQKGK